MIESITKLTNDLIASYAKVGGINHLDGGNLPSKFAIASITTDLLRLLLPGFFDEKPIQTSELKVEISMLMDFERNLPASQSLPLLDMILVDLLDLTGEFSVQNSKQIRL